MQENQENQSTPKQATEGAVAELKKAEEMAKSVGGDTTSPTLSGGKATAPGQKVAAAKHAANDEKQAAKKAAQAEKKATKTAKK